MALTSYCEIKVKINNTCLEISIEWDQFMFPAPQIYFSKFSPLKSSKILNKSTLGFLLMQLTMTVHRDHAQLEQMNCQTRAKLVSVRAGSFRSGCPMNAVFTEIRMTTNHIAFKQSKCRLAYLI